MGTDRKVVIHYSQSCVFGRKPSCIPSHQSWLYIHISLKYKVMEAVQQILNVCEPHCSEFLPFVITHFYIISMIFRDWFWWIRMRPHGWQIGFPHSAAIEQITFSSVTLLLSLINGCCFCALWYLMLWRNVDILPKINIHDFGCYCMFVDLVFDEFLETNKHSHWKIIAMFLTVWSQLIMNVETVLCICLKTPQLHNAIIFTATYSN